MKTSSSFFVEFIHVPFSPSVSTGRSEEEGEDCRAHHCRPLSPRFSIPKGVIGEVVVYWSFPMPGEALLSISQGVASGRAGHLGNGDPTALCVCVCVVGASPSNYVALMITVPHDPASQWGSILIAGWLSCWSMKAPPGCVLYLSDSHLSPNHPLPTSHGNNISSGKHTYLKYCSFHHQNVNHSFAFLGRWNLWGLQLPKLCKQPLFKISLEYVLHRKKKLLCGNWALKLPWKYIYNCI